MLEIVKNYNHRSAIFLQKTGGGTLATFVVFDLHNFARLIGKKVLNDREVLSLFEQKENLEKNNVFIIEEDLSESTILLQGEITPEIYGEIGSLIPSPYIADLFREAEFFSTQKTRGPN